MYEPTFQGSAGWRQWSKAQVVGISEAAAEGETMSDPGPLLIHFNSDFVWLLIQIIIDRKSIKTM